MQTHSTRKFEMGLPLFSGLDLGLILEAQAALQEGKFSGLTNLIRTLGESGKLHTIRKLAAIWTATDIELKSAEADPKVMAELEDLAAAKPFNECFKAAMDFHAALWESLGVSPVSSGPAAQVENAVNAKVKKPKTSAASPSEG
jgi:hypothetical protein